MVKGYTDILFLATAGFALVVGLVFAMYYLQVGWNEIAGVMVNMTQADFGNDSQTAQASQQMYSDFSAFLNSADFLIASLYFGMILFILMSAMLVKFNPIFLPAYVLFTVISVWVSLTLKDTWVQIASDFGWLSSYPISVTILQTMPFIVAIVGGLIILFQYAFRGDYS